MRRKGKTQTDAARAAGVTAGAVSRWLSPVGAGDLEQWRKLSAICRQLGISANEVLGAEAADGPSRAELAAVAGIISAALEVLGDYADEPDELEAARRLVLKLFLGKLKTRHGFEEPGD